MSDKKPNIILPDEGDLMNRREFIETCGKGVMTLAVGSSIGLDLLMPRVVVADDDNTSQRVFFILAVCYGAMKHYGYDLNDKIFVLEGDTRTSRFPKRILKQGNTFTLEGDTRTSRPPKNITVTKNKIELSERDTGTSRFPKKIHIFTKEDYQEYLKKRG